MIEERGPNFAIFVVWSANYVSAQSLEREGSISSFRFYGQLAVYYSHVISLIHLVDEFSFKEMRTWGQSKISFCCLCVWSKSTEMGEERVQDSPVVESFSTDLPARESYWTESHLKFCLTSTTEFLRESMWSTFSWLS